MLPPPRRRLDDAFSRDDLSTDYRHYGKANRFHSVKWGFPTDRVQPLLMNDLPAHLIDNNQIRIRSGQEGPFSRIKSECARGRLANHPDVVAHSQMAAAYLREHQTHRGLDAREAGRAVPN